MKGPSKDAHSSGTSLEAAKALDAIVATDPQAARKFCERVASFNAADPWSSARCTADARSLRMSNPSAFSSMLACADPGATADSLPICLSRLRARVESERAVSELVSSEGEAPSTDKQALKDDEHGEQPAPSEQPVREKSDFSISASWVTCEGASIRVKGKSIAAFEAELEELSSSKDIALRWPAEIDPAKHCSGTRTVDPFGESSPSTPGK
jgi:hypothetical protein